MKIKALSEDIERRTTDLRRYNTHNVIELFDNADGGHDVMNLGTEDQRDQVILAHFEGERSELLEKRNELIKELMREGSRKGKYAADYTSGIGNVRAYDLACRQSLDLLLLRKGSVDAELVLTLHLLTGRFEELYNLCCHYMRRGTDVSSREGLDMIGHEQIRNMNIKESYAAEPGYLDDRTLFGDDKGTNLVSLIHIFILKCMLQRTMENLHHINTNFLDNKDCINLIGEYVGLKKEWIITDNINWYRDQAHEVARIIHCCNMYGYGGYAGKVNECFMKIKGIAREYFACESSEYWPDKTSIIDRVIHSGMSTVDSFGLSTRTKLTHDQNAPHIFCSELKASYEADLAIIYKFEVRSLLMDAVGRINILAGWNVVGSGNYRPPPDSSRPHLCLSEFVTDAMKACPEFSFNNIFDSPHLSDILYGTSRHDSMTEDMEELFDENAVSFLDEALLICISLEQKLAYCNFQKNKYNDDATNILSQLREDSNPYTSEPLPDSEDFAVRVSIDSGVNMESITMANKKLVTALFKQGLATKENLEILFGRSGYASYQIWKLQKQKEERRQPSIWSFITNSRLWKEGCTDIDRRSGLKIKYLNRQDRSQKFVELMQELTRLVPIGSILGSVVPSVEQFVSKFGWKCLGDKATKQFLMEWISSYEIGTDKVLNIEDSSNPKRRRCDIDSFITVEDACRHYFDTKSLEEAIWDAAGVPRIIILNGNKERMQKAGWKNYKGGIRGDMAVKLGCRVAHVYVDGLFRRKNLLAVYEEQVKPVYKDRPEVFSGFDEFQFRLDFTC